MLHELDRWSRWAVVATLLLLPVIIYGAVHLPVGSASVHEWLPDGRVERQRYERFLSDFGTDQFVLISWEGCTLNDARMTAFQDRVEGEPAGFGRLIESVQTTRELLQSLTDAPLNLSSDQAERRLNGILIGRAGLCALVVRVSDYGLQHQSRAMEHLYSSADAVPELGRDRLRMAGTIYESHSVDRAAEQSLRQLVLPSSVLGIVLACACLRSLLAAVAVLVMAGVGQLLAIAVVYYTGGHFSAVLIVLPTLVFMLTLSSAVHLMNYYVDVSARHTDHLGSRALLLGFKPSVLATLTTALGMAALGASQLAPIREFGLYSSGTLCVASLFLLIVFPALSDWFYGRRAKELALRGKTSLLPEDPPNQDVAQPSHPDASQLISEAQQIIVTDAHAVTISPLAKKYTAWMQRHASVVAASGFLLILLSLYGLLFLRASTSFNDMFTSDSPTIRDMQWLEEHLGPISSVEVLLRFRPESSLSTYDRLQWVDRVTATIRDNPQLGYAISATTFLPSFPRTGSLRDVTRRSILRKSLEQSVPKLAERGWVVENEAGQTWRVTAKVPATGKEDLGVLTHRVLQTVEHTQREKEAELPFEVEVTGLSPVMYTTQLTLIDDLGISFTAAFVLITPVMMFIARGFWTGLLIMLPNVLPETLVFGGMAWLGFRLDIAGLLTASVAMGIAVNDTLHFVNWYARRLAQGDSRCEAIADTLSSCAAAMFHTMLISCCSMLPFVFADFVPTRQFAFLMIAMLSSAILGDLVLLPALLLSPLGVGLTPRKKLAPLLSVT